MFSYCVDYTVFNLDCDCFLYLLIEGGFAEQFERTDSYPLVNENLAEYLSKTALEVMLGEKPTSKFKYDKKAKAYKFGYTVCVYQQITKLRYKDISHYLNEETVVSILQQNKAIPMDETINRLNAVVIKKYRCEPSTVKQRREEMGISVYQFVRITGLPNWKYLHEIENKSLPVQCLSAEVVIKMLEVLKCTYLDIADIERIIKGSSY